MLFDGHYGLASTEHLRREGVSKAAVKANLAAKRWQRVFHGVYANFTGPIDRPTVLRAAILHVGYPAALSHITAAEHWGLLQPDAAGPIHITVPYGHSVRSKTNRIALHRSRAFRHIVLARDPLPITDRADTVIDIAVAEPETQAALQRFLALAGRSGVNPYVFAERLLARPPRRYRVALNEAVALYVKGICSALEEKYLHAVERAHGLPEGLRQQPFHVNGITLWEDVCYDNVGATLTVRLDGKEFHSSQLVLFRDRHRDNAAELAGRSRLTYGWQDVTTNPCAVAVEVAAVLERHGWTGETHHCSRCSRHVSRK